MSITKLKNIEDIIRYVLYVIQDLRVIKNNNNNNKNLVKHLNSGVRSELVTKIKSYFVFLNIVLFFPIIFR